MEMWIALLIMIMSVVMGGLLTWIIGKAQQVHLLHKLRDAVIDRERVSINEEFLMTRLLADKIQNDGYAPDMIFAICPGGAMIAEWLSRRFLGGRSTSIPVQLLYMRREQKDKSTKTDVAKVDDKLTQIPPELPQDSRILLVNDISRGGFTLKAAEEFLKNQYPNGNIRTVTLIYHTDASVKPMYYAAETKKAIRFDWKSYDQ